MNREDVKLNQKVKYFQSTQDLNSEYEGIEDFEEKEYFGEIVGIGSEGIVVEFGEDFNGHDGLCFQESNGVAIHGNNHHWYFDFDRSNNFERTLLIDKLELIE